MKRPLSDSNTQEKSVKKAVSKTTRRSSAVAATAPVANEEPLEGPLDLWRYFISSSFSMRLLINHENPSALDREQIKEQIKKQIKHQINSSPSIATSLRITHSFSIS